MSMQPPTSGKQLSASILNLRFMQNALREQQLEQVDLPRAEVKDEGKWEISQDVKNALGIGKTPKQSNSVVYESSYLPFLFSDADESTINETPKLLGRRAFDKNGRDISVSQSQSQSNAETAMPQSADGGEELVDPLASPNPTTEKSLASVPSQKGRRFKVHSNPIPISSISGGRKLYGLDSFDDSKDSEFSGREKRNKDPSSFKQQTSAKQAIFDMSGVGSDLRSARKSEAIKSEASLLDQPKQPTTGFLKPTGVDEPPKLPVALEPSSPSKPESSSLPDAIDGARKKSSKAKSNKRERDGSDPNEPSEDRKKKKKKKKAVAE